MTLTYGFTLNNMDNSAQFSEAFRSVIGDGVCDYGRRFELMLNGFTLTLESGFALVNGRYLKSDEPYTLTLSPSGNYNDRYDAIAIRADYAERKTSVEVLTGIDPEAIRASPDIIRSEKEYSVILYIVHVRRGATVLGMDDITDTRDDAILCGQVTKTCFVSGDTLYVYNFLQSGIDEKVSRLLEMSNAVIDKANKAIRDLDAAISTKGQNSIGDVVMSISTPLPVNAWLLCNGEHVPDGYSRLNEMHGGYLPVINPADARLSAYIYGGLPM